MFKGSPKDIIKQYQNIVGRPILPSFWALGWHAGSEKYQTQADVQANIDAYTTANIPLEGIWLDYSYMDTSLNFLMNVTAFPNITELQNYNRKLVVKINSVLMSDSKDEHYTSAVL